MQMQGAVLRKTKLEGADLSGARLDGVDFNAASLQTANLSRANFKEAILNEADLRGANLRYAVGLTREQVELARIDKNTLMPSHLKVKWNSETKFEILDKKN